MAGKGGNDMRIIGLHGRKGVGKNFVAKVIADVLIAENTQDIGPSHVVTELAFADPIKNFCENVLLCDRKSLYGDDKAKNAPTKYNWESMPGFVQEKNPGKTGVMTHRHVMQVFGTEFTRDIWNKNIWTDVMKHRISCIGQENGLITDVRFQNEIDEIHRWGGVVWRIEGPYRVQDSKDSHESEKAIDSTVRVDTIIRNDWSDNQETIATQVRKALGFNGPLQ